MVTMTGRPEWWETSEGLRVAVERVGSRQRWAGASGRASATISYGSRPSTQVIASASDGRWPSERGAGAICDMTIRDQPWASIDAAQGRGRERRGPYSVSRSEFGGVLLNPSALGTGRQSLGLGARWSTC